ncbi:membrane protein [Colletotrichum karsti]|uniref:Membrane protein n=1 Tax=Colletotrichum karsti TaxID=1095194 RepID=A0A9P6IC91_9PEZI|nr:uncharacterized protein CkaCkLH20_01779 [Colletotrichum karsti]KAF9880737.1 membrane protein [Colletotrichum karsti]
MERHDDERTVLDRHGSRKSEPTLPQTQEAKRTQRLANLYDAVAGRITYDTSLGAATSNEKTTARANHSRPGRHSVRATTLPPEEVLFRRKAAPERFQEFDIYMAHDRNLPDGGRESLPDSDLLKAVHTYASHFYSALGGQQRGALYQIGSRNIDERSMDESALLAFGILLEEAGRDVLGSKGDMVFTEGLDDSADIDAASEGRLTTDNMPSQTLTVNTLRPPTSVGFADPGSWKRPQKRRKVTDPDDI